uniref:Uncharacterized protein n=1 Tax=Onchocerca volvulus TaxID=6282 RepID=A0A8R1TLL4_ONCVO
MVHSPKHISHITNIKLEPYSVVTDISTADTDYTSIASNESFNKSTPYMLDGQPVCGPWSKPTLSTKNHSESNQIHQLKKCIENDMKKNSFDATTNAAIHSESKIKIEPSEELSENNLHEKISISIREPMNYRRAMLKSGEISLGTKIEATGESSTDQDLTINETEKIKVKVLETMPNVTLQSASQSIKSNGIHDKISDELITHNSTYGQRKLPTASVPFMAMKTQKLMDATYQTAVSQEDIHLKTDSIEQECNNNSNNINLMKEKYTNELMVGIGKILRKENGGIAALYKNALERPDSRFSKILYSML